MSDALLVSQKLIVGFGFVAATASLLLAIYYFRSPKPIGRSVAWVFAAESLGLYVTVGFSIFAGVFNVLGPWSELAMRLVMFVSAFASSVHMAISIEKILRE